LIAIEAGRNKLVDVLGMMDQIPQSVASSDSTTESAIEILQSLDPLEVKKVKSLICNP